MKLSFSLTSPPDLVFQYLSDPVLFTAVHPLIQSMEPIGQGRYLVREKTKFGFIPYTFTYVAQLTSNSEERTVQIDAVVKKYTRIGLQFEIRPGLNGTIVEENVNVTSLPIIQKYLEGLIRKQHNLLFSNIDLGN